MVIKYQPNSTKRWLAIGVMVGFHVLVGYALVSGLARQAAELVQRPMVAAIIEEVKVPEPPPPPPPLPKPVRQAESPPKVLARPPPYVVPPEVVSPAPLAPAMVMEAVTRAPEPAALVAAPSTAQPGPVASAAAAPSPVVAAAPKRMEIGVTCPTQVAPEMPRRAVHDGIGGLVRAQIRVQAGVVVEVQILSGPRVFHDNVRRAMLKYKCISDGEQEITATQEFNFKVE